MWAETGAAVVIWTGWGFLALVLAALGGLGGTFLGVALGAPEDQVNLGTTLGLLLAAAGIWLLGRRLNDPRPGFHPDTGERVVYRNRHRLWFVPMQYWAAIVAVGGVVAAVLVVSA